MGASKKGIVVYLRDIIGYEKFLERSAPSGHIGRYHPYAIGGIWLNSSIFSKDSTIDFRELYKRNVGEWLERKNKKLEIWKKRSEGIGAQISAAEERNDKTAVARHKKTKEDLDNLISDVEKNLAVGFTRHNVFLSRETMLRNIVQHEAGHTVDDMLLGTQNWVINLISDKLTESEIKLMSNEMKVLFGKSRTNCGWLSTYGAENRDEFLAECMVIYSDKGGEGLPLDIKAWFDKLKSMSVRK